ncbi:maleylpyruvate isomerase family mycothiol-dependent enzyme [Actinopolymorpha sp. NPDC004070]|uniref:maleylpyruvate isomerase family mycothiol-dependent enzyme n=1 Tax=Actinopolymorpha sp. NPDC004070 TaxID=3154548 RepID=UPI0033AA25EE
MNNPADSVPLHGAFDPPAYAAFIRAEAARLLAAYQTGPATARVPSCPEWSLADLVAHTGRVHRWAARIVRTGEFPGGGSSTVPAPVGPELGPWYAESVEVLLDQLAATDPARPTWAFGDGGTAEFWSRRQTHEVCIHRADAELAIGVRPVVDPGLAADGVGEVVEVMMPRSERFGPHRLVAPVLLTYTDHPDRWLVSPPAEPDGVPVGIGPALTDTEVAAATATVAGTAGDLLLALWRRLPATEHGCRFTVDGDQAAARAVLDVRVVP